MTRPVPGVADEVATGVRRILAPNAGAMTYWGTNTYLVGAREVAVIDPGPASPDHLAAILKAAGGARITHILITHAHLDHSHLAAALSAETAAPVLAFGPAETGRATRMAQLHRDGLAAGGEGVDQGFAPDERLGDGDTVTADGWRLEVLHTPGHFAGHLSFRLGDILFSGDHIMDWSTTLISPPDGDLSAFMASTRRLQALGLARLLPAHGPPVTDPSRRMADLLDHRQAREQQIIDAVANDHSTIPAITARVYHDLAPHLIPAAERNVFAHLIDLTDRNLIQASPELSLSAKYAPR